MADTVLHRSAGELEAALEVVRAAPRDEGRVELIVARPAVDERVEVDHAELTPGDGLVGDTWRARGSRHTPDRSAEPARQVTLMSSRAAEAVAAGRDRWGLAGDQLYVDFDLSDEHLPAGTRLRVGAAVVEISEAPHTGCGKFSARFGAEALAWVNSPEGRALRLRGVNASVVEPGAVRLGDAVTRLPG